MNTQTKSNKEDKADKNKKEGKAYTVIVNGRQREVEQKEMTFAEIVALAYDGAPTGANTIFTVTYRRGKGNKPEGTLVAGESVKIKDEMVFNVTATDKS